MRVPNEAAMSAAANPIRRYQVLLLAAIVAIIVLLIALQGFANLFTNYLWYRSETADAVWRTMTVTKIELDLFFMGLFFIACWVSLLVVDRVAPRALFMAPEQEVVRRYQTLVGRHRFAVRTFVSVVLALIVGAGAASQWQHWLLFLHGRRFGVADPLFHKDISYFVFKLPFLSFLVNWIQVSLIVLAIICAIAYYLNGGLRFSGPSPRVDPRATQHFSVIFAALALVKAAGYFYVNRYGLDLAPGGLFQGAGYTSVHVRLPALNLLTIVALAAFVLFVVNIYARGWLLPAVAAGLWAFIAIVIGVIFPWAVQSLQVSPAQSSLELPYLMRNMEATRAAYNLDSGTVTVVHFPANHDVSPAVITADAASLEDVALWNPSISVQSWSPQRLKNFYSINGVSLDRYELSTTPGDAKQLVPVVIGVREISPANLNRPTWVNTHLVDTHGYGVVMAQANTSTSGPNFALEGIPVQQSQGAPTLANPDVYFGVGQTGYVVVDSRQAEYNYQSGSGNVVTNHYTGPGGIRVGSIWQRAAFALRFHDFNLLVSRLVTANSRIMFNQDVRTIVQKVAPFLVVDSNPYPVIDDGHIDWIVDAYTTTNNYPYSQAATGAGLPGSFNYVRNSVKAVVDAYTGKVTLYAWDPSDPILQSWERIFPGMFKPASDMDSTLAAHLRYPQALLSVEATMFGKYHLPPSQAATFYNNSAAWQVSLSGTGGSSGSAVQPQYQLLQLPGQPAPTFNAFVPLVPAGSGRAQNLTAFLVADCSKAGYGNLTAYEVPAGGAPVAGPAIANAAIDADTTVADAITLLDQAGSRAVFGPTLIIPIEDSLVYVRPLFGVSTSNAIPRLDYIIVYYGGRVTVSPQAAGDTAALTGAGGALTEAIPAAISVGPSGPANLPGEIVQEIKQADTLEAAAFAEAKSGDISAFGSDEVALKKLLDTINSQISKLKGVTTPSTSGSKPTTGHSSRATGGSSSTTTTTTAPKKTTSSKKSSVTSTTRASTSGGSESGA